MASNRPSLERFRNADDAHTQAWLRLEASRAVFRQGDFLQARRLVLEAVRIAPHYADAWLQLAELARDQQEREALLQRVLSIEPGHVQARAELARLQRATPRGRASNYHRSWAGRWIILFLILAVGVLLAVLMIWGPIMDSLAALIVAPVPTTSPTPTHTPGEVAAQFVPQLQAALAAGNWDRAVDLVGIMRGVDPAGSEVQGWILVTDLQYGQALVQDGQADRAQALFDEAVALAPGDEQARLWQQVTRLYLAGQTALEARDWNVAIQSFQLVHEQMPNYGDVLARLAEAYYGQGMVAAENQDWTAAIEALSQAHDNAPADSRIADLLAACYRQRGIAQQEQDALQEAKADLEAALALRPDDAEAKTHLDEVMYVLFPPKRIEINITTQEFFAWEGDTLVYSFLTSTGLPGRDTAAGSYKVLDKMPMAYSSVWDLKMPFWLGIYYVGNIENGIHALPIRPDGTVMWGGLLGQKASYGCIILSTEAAQTIYDWAEIGTSVEIHY
jgi:tetratricopeptide (TPR) repeat protein